MAGSLVKLSESIFEVFILCFQSCLCSFCIISSGLCVQFRHLLANLRKIYINDVNIDASQADCALNWTARITKNIPSISGLLWLLSAIRIYPYIKSTHSVSGFSERVWRIKLIW